MNKMLALTILMLTIIWPAVTSAAPVAETGLGSGQTVVYIPVDTEVQFGLGGFIKRAISEARANSSAAVILGIDTFGGRVDSALDIINHIESAGDIPVVAYVTDKAWSAGALIALGCDQIIMKSGSSIGSATPVAGGGPAGQTQALSEKYVSAIRAKFRSVAEKNGYPPTIAAAMVDKDIEVKQVRIDNQLEFLTNDEIELLKEQKKQYKVEKVISAKDKLLNLTAEQAVEVTIAVAVSNSINDVLAQLNLSGARVDNKQRNWSEQFASFVTGATLSGLLLMIGLMALYTEMSNPGFGWAGILGLACLGLLFWGKYIVNLAEMTEMIIFFAGVVLLLIEIFVIPGFGVTGIAGLAFMGLGLYLAFVPFVVPEAPWDFNLFFKTATIMILAVAGSITGFLVLMHFLPELPGMKRLVLTTALGQEKIPASGSESKRELAIGQQGQALSDLRPVGKAEFEQDVVDVVAETGYINKKEKIKIIKVEGNRIVVRAVKKS